VAAARGRRIAHVTELPAAARRARWHASAAVGGNVPDVVALAGGWLAIVTPPGRGAFDRLLRTMLAVAGSLPVGSLNEGLRRGMAARGLPWSVPDDVLRAYLAHRGDVHVDGEWVTAVVPPSADALAAMDRHLVAAVRDSPTGTLRYHQVGSLRGGWRLARHRQGPAGQVRRAGADRAGRVRRPWRCGRRTDHGRRLSTRRCGSSGRRRRQGARPIARLGCLPYRDRVCPESRAGPWMAALAPASGQPQAAARPGRQ